MRKGKSKRLNLAERRRERARGHTPPRPRTGNRQNAAATAKTKSDGVDPIGYLCDVLSNESVPDGDRKEAADELLPYYHPKLAKIGPLLKRYLCEQRGGTVKR
jgi:hypothetical protein